MHDGRKELSAIAWAMSLFPILRLINFKVKHTVKVVLRCTCRASKPVQYIGGSVASIFAAQYTSHQLLPIALLHVWGLLANVSLV